MTTDSLPANEPDVSSAFADAWAAVFIDVYEKLRDRGELPDDAEDVTSHQNDGKSPLVEKQVQQGELPCLAT
jgi:hypothetical protein